MSKHDTVYFAIYTTTTTPYPRSFFKEQLRSNDAKADRRNLGLITSQTELVTEPLPPYAQLKTDSYGGP